MATQMTAPEASWEQIDAELGKADQMGYQTVIQFAKVGEMLKQKKGEMSLREFVPYVGQYIPRLSKSTIHRYLALADNMPLLEQRQPESLNAAVAAITDARRSVPDQKPVAAPNPASRATRSRSGRLTAALLAAPCIVDIDYDEDDHDAEKPLITLSMVARIAVADAVLKSPEEAWAEAQAGHVTINGETLAVPVEDACYFLSIVFKGTQIADLAEKKRMALWVERMAEESRLKVEQARLERKAIRKPTAAAK